jgi:hypothetical protein
MAQLATVEWQTLCKVAFILAAITDVLISLVMVFFLQKRKTGFQKTTDLVNRLVGSVFLNLFARSVDRSNIDHFHL